MRRFTRLTNGFQRSLRITFARFRLHYMYYNFVRIHKTLRCTPAIAADVTKTFCEIEDIVALLD